jgi:hypothetical protein
LKVRTYFLLLFSKRTPLAKKPLMSKVGDVVVTDGKDLLNISILSLAVNC